MKSVQETSHFYVTYQANGMTSGFNSATCNKSADQIRKSFDHYSLW